VGGDDDRVCGLLVCEVSNYELQTYMETPDQLVPLRILARELRVDRSHFRRYVLRLGITPQKRHTADSGNKLVVTVTSKEAECIRAARRQQGYDLPAGEADETVGVFYVVQVVPELDPNRIKLGFAEDATNRLAQHRTAAPTAKLLKSWPCKRSWEWTIIDALSTAGCKLILNEVYECCDLRGLLAQGDQLFAMLPDPRKPVPLSEASPNFNSKGKQPRPTPSICVERTGSC
jgi:hypothetical protein